MADDSFGIVMKSICDSSLMATGGGKACWAFAMMCAHADKHHCFRMDVRTFARRIDITQDEIKEVISILESPDPHSNIPDHEGRRIIPLSECDDIEGNRGYYIVNRDYYQKLLKNNGDSSSKERVIKSRRKKKIINEIESLTGCNVTVTLQEESLFIFIFSSISIDIIKLLINRGVDLNLWARFEDHRKNIKAPLKTDQGRTRMINDLLKNSSKPGASQEAIIQQSIDFEWKGLFELKKDRKPSDKPASQTLLQRVHRERSSN